MRFLIITIKTLLEGIRDKKGAAMLFLFPAAFMLAFGFAFSGEKNFFLRLIDQYKERLQSLLNSGGSFSIFYFLAPGIIVFAILLLAIGVAITIAREIEKGTLERLKISKMTSFDLLFGIMLSWTIIAIIQIIIMFSVAIAMGLNWHGGITSLMLGGGIALLSAISSIALGLLLASFVKTETQALYLGILIAVPLSFIVGAFFPLPRIVIGNFLGKTFQVYDFLPWRHAVNALRAVITFSASFKDVSYDILMMCGLTLGLFLLSVFSFSYFVLRRKE